MLTEDSALISKPCLPWLPSNKLSSWLPCGTMLKGGMRYESESESSIQMNVICLIWLQRISFVIGERVRLFNLRVLFRNHHFFALLPCFSLWNKHEDHSSSYLRGIPFVTSWLAESVLVICTLESSVAEFVSPLSLAYVKQWWCETEYVQNQSFLEGS